MPDLPGQACAGGGARKAADRPGQHGGQGWGTGHGSGQLVCTFLFVKLDIAVQSITTTTKLN